MSKKNRMSDERLTYLLDFGSDKFLHTSLTAGEARSFLEELQSLRSKPVAGVEVKPLEWTCIAGHDGHFWRTTDPVSGCEVTAYTGDQKARHEADYRQRILSTLSLPAQEPTAYGVFLNDGRFMDIASDSRDDAVEMAEIHYVQDNYLIRPLYASPQPEAVITEEMVTRALKAHGSEMFAGPIERGAMRAAITAALDATK